MIDARKDPATRPAAVRRVGEQLGINPETLRGWANQAEVDAGTRGGTTTSDGARLGELEREVRELRRANADPAVGVGFLRGGARPPIPLIDDYIDQHAQEFGVETPDPEVVSSGGSGWLSWGGRRGRGGVDFCWRQGGVGSGLGGLEGDRFVVGGACA